MHELRRSPLGKLLVAVSTWNLHGRPCLEELPALIDGVCASSAASAAPDIFVFCFQEFAELSASNVVLHHSGDELQQKSFEAAAVKALRAKGDYLLLRSVGMVGLLVSAFVRAERAPSVKAVSGERICCGLYGQAGNKAGPWHSREKQPLSVCH